MKVTSTAIQNGKIADIYGKRGPADPYGIPSLSPPLEFTGAPEGTVSYAVIVEDKDAFPVSGGFSWIHWLAANITRPALQEGESRKADFVQGLNSWISPQGGSKPQKACCYYGGMCPPDGEHVYEIHVYALDTMLDLKDGFGLGELARAMDGHILAQDTLKGTYGV